MRKLYKIFIFIVIFIFICILPIDCYCGEDKEYQYYTAIITELKEEIKNDITIYRIKAKLTEGPYENKIIELEHMPILETSNDVEFRKNMSIIVCLQSVNGAIEQISVFDINRKNTIKIITIVFIAVLIIFGGFKGIFATLSLLATFLLIIFCLIPLLLNKTNPILATILVSSISILINFILISGFSKKSFCAIISTIGGTIIAGLFAFYFGNLMALTGLCDDNVQALVTHTNILIDYKGLLFSGMILGTMGAVMDIGMSITSFIFEMKKKQPTISSISLFKSGMNVGKDIMSTMTNTLILAYAGTSLPLFLYFINM
ncbi:MAG: YibE/F family protein [Alkaliphilus sp.]|nr:YibE/F family protein [Alkaliphilus sp.]